MANKQLVLTNVARDLTGGQSFDLILIDGGTSYNMYVRNSAQPPTQPANAAQITSVGGVPVIAPSGGGDVVGLGTTNNLMLWTDGPNSVAGDAILRQVAGNTQLPTGNFTVTAGNIVITLGNLTLSNGTIVQASASATSFVSGPNGATNPVFVIDNSTASQADGVTLAGLAAGSGVRFTATSSGADAGFNFTPKGTGNFVIPTGVLVVGGTNGAFLANEKLHIQAADGVASGIIQDVSGNACANVYRRVNTSFAGPTALVADNEISQFSVRGYDGTSMTATGRAKVSMLAAANWTNISTPTYVSIFTTAVGATAQAERIRVDTNLIITAASVLVWGSVALATPDVGLSRISAGLLGLGTGAAASFAGSLKLTDLFTNNAAALVRTNTTLTNSAGAGAGTLLNAPTAGNPTKWIGIDDNGTTRFIPTWT